MTLFNSEKFKLADYAMNLLPTLGAVIFGAILGLAICKLLSVFG